MRRVGWARAVAVGCVAMAAGAAAPRAAQADDGVAKPAPAAAAVPAPAAAAAAAAAAVPAGAGAAAAPAAGAAAAAARAEGARPAGDPRHAELERLLRETSERLRVLADATRQGGADVEEQAAALRALAALEALERAHAVRAPLSRYDEAIQAFERALAVDPAGAARAARFPVRVLRHGDDVRVFVAGAEGGQEHSLLGAPVDVIVGSGAGAGGGVMRSRVAVPARAAAILAGEAPAAGTASGVVGGGGERRAGDPDAAKDGTFTWQIVPGAKESFDLQQGFDLQAGAGPGTRVVRAFGHGLPFEEALTTNVELMAATPLAASTEGLLAAREDRDVVVLANGDRLGGEVKAASATEVVFATPYGELKIPRDEIAAILFRRPARAFLGIGGEDGADGVRVTSTVDGSAAAAVLRTGDRIVAIDGAPVTSFDALSGLIRARKPGTKVALRVIRPVSEGVTQELVVTVELGKAP